MTFDIVYRKGKENRAADALSRLPAEEDESQPTSFKRFVGEPVNGWIDKILNENKRDEWILKIRAQVKDQTARDGFKIRGEF